MTGIRSNGGGEHLILVCDDCGGTMDLALGKTASGRVSGDAAATTGWEGRRGSLGPHFCPACVVGRGPAAVMPASP
jgi:hypothetical protein